MGKTKAKKPAQDVQDEKPRERRLPVQMSTREVMVGMDIVVTVGPDGYVEKSSKIRTLSTGEGCLNLHVNDTACYDRGVPIRIALPESAAIARMSGIDFADMILLTHPEFLEEMR